MSDNDDKSLESLGLTAEERTRAIAEEQRRLKKLADEVAGRYDPTRLSRVSVAGAGTAERLDDGTRREMERRLGANFSDVRVVRGAFADRVTKHHRADAVTLGATGLILLRDTPRANLKSNQGRALLAHELTHVRQAKAGMKFAHEPGADESHSATEDEALEVEGEFLHGGAGHGRHHHMDPEQRLERISDRVLEKVSEAQRHDLELHGFDDQ